MSAREAHGAHDPTFLPPDIPVPHDDGAAKHLAGTKLPDLALPATSGPAVNLSKLTGRAVVYIYPRTGMPGIDAPPGWDDIPGARGCTPQSCGFRDHFAELKALGVGHVYGISTQNTAYQREVAERLHLPFPVLSDADLKLAHALKLPTFTTSGMTRCSSAWRWSSTTAASSRRSIRCFRRTRTRQGSLCGCAATVSLNGTVIEKIHGGNSMPKFVVAPHFRLQEWVAEEKGYFRAEGLDYEFRETMDSSAASGHHIGDKVGAYQTIEAGRTCNVSGACHWTVNVAASNGHGKLYADCYSVSPCGVFVPPDSPVKAPADLAGVPISVGYQSGSHYSTIQGLEQYLKPEDIKLSFNDGLLFSRMERLIDRKVPAASLFSGPYFFAEQLGFRKIIDTTFMIASTVTGDPDPEDVRKYFRALRRAQRDIDLRPELYTHYYRKEFPARFQDQMDTRRWGPGERLVFEPYSKETFEESFAWIERHGIFPRGEMGSGNYESSIYT
jgi:peroxiredoxin/ABC-type nitrate/sulfonate/bicarbonate transport system substrate-binding protein